MRPFRTARLLALSVTALGLSACDYECGTVHTTVAGGTVRDPAGLMLGSVETRAIARVGPESFWITLHLTAPAGSAGAPLAGHLSRARVIADGGASIAELPIGPATGLTDEIIAYTGDMKTRAEYDRVRALLLTGRARLVLDTDLPGREHIETTLSAVHEEPGTVLRCSAFAD